MRFVEFLLGSIPVLIQLYAQKNMQEDLEKTITDLQNEINVPITKTYDFVIVGGGTAGCVLAGRLSENFKVLLLEAGGEPPPAVAVPFFSDSVQKDPTVNYFFKSKATVNTPPNTVKVVSGKMLGGSGSHNSMIHNRGSPYDFDNWGTLVNDSSWDYNNVIHYFKRSENFMGKQFGPKSEVKFYGTDGPIRVQQFESNFLESWLQAGAELGYKVNDPNGFQTESFSPLSMSIHNGMRSSSYAEYIKPFENTRENLTVIRYAVVSEIFLDENNRAYGVGYSHHNFSQIAHATKEVIVSAGTYSSPLLLMKSGVGPHNLLKAAKIPVKVGLESVGHNLGEHAAVQLRKFSVNDTTLFPQLVSSQTDLVLEQFHEGKGLLSTYWKGAQLFKVSRKSDKKDWPDLYIKISPPVIFDNAEATANFTVVLGRPKSKGIISLDIEKYLRGITDDTQLALIDFKLLTHPDDMEVLIEGVKFVFDIIEKTQPFKRVNMTYEDDPMTTCSEHAFKSDDYWRCYIAQSVTPWQHLVGTCSMGPEFGDSNYSVVDNRFRVRGVLDLRVVDASVIPSVPNANPNAAVIMLAEKAADEIKKYWNNGQK